MDLKGQLSNPRGKLETLAPQGSQRSRRLRNVPAGASEQVVPASDGDPSEEKGQHSNPTSLSPARQSQGRLKPAEIDQLLAAYRAEELVNDIAAKFEVNRTTVIGHVNRSGLPRRSDLGWTEAELQAAATLYADGRSLAAVGRRFGIDASTVANRFRRAGVPVRQRRGCA